MKFSKNLFMALFLVIGMVVIGKSNNVFAAGLYEQEKNDDYASANVLLPNSSITGNISDYDDKDYYVVQPTANGKLELTFNHTYQDENAHWGVSIYLYDSGTYTELSYTGVGLNDDEKIKLPSVGVKKSGLYYIVVARDWEDIIGIDYTIASKFTPTENYEKELNNVYGTATSLNIGKPMQGNISNSDDKDYYVVQPTANGKLELTFEHTYQDENAHWGVSVYLYDSGTYTELNYTDVGLNDDEKIKLSSVGVKKSGLYYIVVTRDWENIIGIDYTITSKFTSTENYEKELNDVYGTATSLNIGKTMHGNISDDGDKDYYKIVMPLTGYYRLNFKHTYQDSSGGWSVRVYKASGGKYTELSNTRISLNSSSQTNLPSVGMTASASYYIKVEGDYDAIGCDYSLKVSLSANGPAVINTKSMKKAIKISWIDVSGANGYEVYYKVGKTGKYKIFKSTKKTSVKFTNAKKRKKYYFKVRGYVKTGGKIYYSVFSKAKSARCK